MKLPILFSAPILAAMQSSPKKRRRNNEDEDKPHTAAYTVTPQRPIKRTKKAPTPFEITTHKYEEPSKVGKADSDSGNHDDTFSIEEREEYATLLRSTVCLPSNSNAEREWDWYYNLRQRLDKNALPDVLRGRLEDLRRNDDRLANLDIAIARVKAVEEKRREKEHEEKARAEKELAERHRLEEERQKLERKERERVAEEKAAKERRAKQVLESTLAGVRREAEDKARVAQQQRKRLEQEKNQRLEKEENERQEEALKTVVNEQPVGDELRAAEEPTHLEQGITNDLRVDSVMESYPPIQEEPENEEEVNHEAAAEEVRLAQERRSQLLAGVPASSIPGLPSKQFMLDHLAEQWPTLRDGLNAMTPKDLKREADMQVLDKLFIDPGEMCFLCLTSMASDEEIVGTGWNVKDLSQLARCLYCAPKEEPYVRMMESLQRIKGIIGDANSRLMTARIEARAKAAASGKASQPRTTRR